MTITSKAKKPYVDKFSCATVHCLQFFGHNPLKKVLKNVDFTLFEASQNNCTFIQILQDISDPRLPSPILKSLHNRYMGNYNPAQLISVNLKKILIFLCPLTLSKVCCIQQKCSLKVENLSLCLDIFQVLYKSYTTIQYVLLLF